MVTGLGLQAIAPERFAAAGASFRALADRLARRAEEVARAQGQLGLDWSGPAALAALDRCALLAGRLRQAADVALRCDQALCELAEQVRRARDQLAREQNPHEAARRLASAVPVVDAADLACAARLRELATFFRRTGTAVRTPVTCTVDASPTDVAAWWAALPQPARRWLVAHHPRLIGGLDGVPAADRDAANRVLLRIEWERLLVRRANATPDEASAIDAHLAGIAAIEARLADPERPRAYLLYLSTEDDGQAVVAIGNPDHATDVITYVPGAGARLSRVEVEIRRADALAQAATKAAPDHQVSSIAWLGYDAPDGAQAVFAQSAHAAEPALRRFAAGLRATHDGPPSHNTLLGHSYGSLVIGVTARDGGLDADELVFVGSPGVGAGRVSGLKFPAEHVWSSTAAADPIQRFAPGLGQLLVDFGASLVSPTHLPIGDPHPDLLLWHGTNPSTRLFGARVFASGDGGHSSYWQGIALENIARIAVGLTPQ